MIGVGVKIPQLGYLDSHPVKSAFGKFEEFLLTCDAVLVSIVFDVSIKGFKKPMELCNISSQ